MLLEEVASEKYKKTILLDLHDPLTIIGLEGRNQENKADLCDERDVKSQVNILYLNSNHVV